jgi:hypothetical protein
MAEFISAIHDFKKHFNFNEVVDARHKGGHDAEDGFNTPKSNAI